MTAQFDHAWDDPRLNEGARAYLKTRPENLGDVWERIVRDAVGGDTTELSRVRNKRSVETPASEGVEIVDTDANGVPVRLYLPVSRNRPKKIVLYFHGGGWVVGSIQSCSRFCGELAKAADVIVAAAAYRLAPEFPYTAAVKDCREAYLWIQRHAVDYGGDDRCIYAAGDSAGGNLAVVLALQERLSGLILFYPVTTVVPGSYGESWEEFSHGYALDAKLMEAFAEAYVPEILRDNPLVSPLESADLSRLPQTLCITAECDILRDQGKRFCDQLRKAGVPVTERCFPGAVHLFVTVTGMGGDFRKGVFECTAFLQK